MGRATGEAGPRLVLPNVAERWLTTVNYDLLIFDDRLVAVRGLTLRGGLADGRTARETRRALGVAAEGTAWERQTSTYRETCCLGHVGCGPRVERAGTG